MFSGALCWHHAATSRSTHGELADGCDASSISHREPSNAVSIDDQRSGFADKLASSRKTRNARRLFHGLAKSCRPCCRLGASISSAEWA